MLGQVAGLETRRKAAESMTNAAHLVDKVRLPDDARNFVSREGSTANAAAEW